MVMKQNMAIFIGHQRPKHESDIDTVFQSIYSTYNIKHISIV